MPRGKATADNRSSEAQKGTENFFVALLVPVPVYTEIDFTGVAKSREMKT